MLPYGWECGHACAEWAVYVRACIFETIEFLILAINAGLCAKTMRYPRVEYNAIV